MASPKGKSKKGGKSNRKFGRGHRAPSNAKQALRTAENRGRKRAKAHAQALRDAKKAFEVKRGLTRTQRRSKSRWAKSMLTAKAKKADARKIAEAARHGGRITMLPSAESLAMVAAWAKARDAQALRAKTNKGKFEEGLMIQTVKLQHCTGCTLTNWALGALYTQTPKLLLRFMTPDNLPQFSVVEASTERYGDGDQTSELTIDVEMDADDWLEFGNESLLSMGAFTKAELLAMRQEREQLRAKRDIERRQRNLVDTLRTLTQEQLDEALAEAKKTRRR